MKDYKKILKGNNLLDYKLNPEDLKKETSSRTIDTHVFINAKLIKLMKIIKVGANKECDLQLNKSKLINMAILRLFNELEGLSMKEQLIFLKDLELQYYNYRSS